ncbi:Outer membrane receptor proteins, mostly Fe transport [Filimonas lacunae]|uniref:Outer membrane receptor proteins, mostly Fe transport n=1 Tax=Filimonas lacunae TaxID=477680 RepID=A0A173MKT4_9BACT|nr:TonB-dependent receptor plug domain-containing protein [Filimonas lacunae]BAV08008.1 TonB-dependent receptor [Filimonas lacunae]SIT07850.1 Outer membrane receptor proteins, mostly Fe transport [Filimonas lacunae]
MKAYIMALACLFAMPVLAQKKYMINSFMIADKVIAMPAITDIDGIPTPPNDLKQVTVKSTKNNHLLQSQTGLEKFLLKDTKQLPTMLGERDILKTIQLLPGVKSAGDGNSGFYVRGGGADQNLVLLDDAPVYNPAHFLGFFSTFNADAIKEVSLYKGAMPAQYGGRLSSVLDVSMNEGDKEQWKVSGGAGLIATRLSVEGPLQKEKSSFLISGRRTYADMYLKLSHDSDIRKNRMNFYDLNGKFSWSLGKKDKLSISGYTGHDVLNLSGLFGLNWGNKVGAVHWNHTFNDRVSVNTAATYSNYDYTAAVTQANYNVSMYSSMKDVSGKTEVIYAANANYKMHIGTSATYHHMVPGNAQNAQKGSVNNVQQPTRNSLENALYVQNEWQASDKLLLSYGTRVTAFSVLGTGDFYRVDGNGVVTDTLRYSPGQRVATYINLEPRVSASFQLTQTAAVKASYTRNVQNLHLIANTTSASPTDRWVASTNIIKPEIADQFSVGYYKNLADNQYQVTVETYYKNMQNQIDYRNGADVFDNQALESKLLYGKGRAYGIETLIKKRKGKLTGWVAYTLSKTERKIDGINNNQWYNARQDRTHELAIVAAYQLSNRFSVAANWVFYTGNAVTFPAGKYIINNQVVYYYTNRNSYRMPDYHRLDVNATVSLFKKKKFSSDLSVGIYNAYGRENAFSVFFRQSKTQPGQTEAVQVALFKFVPSLSYDFKF